MNTRTNQNVTANARLGDFIQVSLQVAYGFRSSRVRVEDVEPHGISGSEEPPDLWPERRRRFRLGEEVGVLTRPFAGRATLAKFEELHAELMGLKQTRGLDLVVFDSLAYFLPARDENSAGAMANALAPFLALAEAGLAVWLLHHPSKGEPALGQAARGSGALLASVDIFLEMRHPGGNPFTRRRKLFGWSRYQETPWQMLIELSPDGLTYERLADASDDFHSAWDTIGSVLLAAGVPMTQQEIRSAWPLGLRNPTSPRCGVGSTVA